MAKSKTTKAPAFNTNIHAIFGTDTSLEEEGAWVDVNVLYGLRIKVRRMRSDVALKAYERIVKETLGEGQLRKPGDINDKQSLEILKRQLAESILIDWENLRDSDTGDDIPYSAEVALELMEVKDFREFVYQAAMERETFRGESDEAAEGN